MGKNKHDSVEDSSSNAGYTLKRSRMKYYRQPAHPTADLQSQRLESYHLLQTYSKVLVNLTASAMLFFKVLLGHSTVCIVNGGALLPRHSALSLSLSQLALTCQQFLPLLIDLPLHFDFDFSEFLFLAT